MTSHRNKYKISLLTLLLAGLVFPVLWGCKEQTNPPVEETFVRLLTNEALESVILKKSINYAVLLPENYNTSTDSFPVVYLLHGFGDNESAWYNGGRIRYYSGKYSSEISPAIYVMPEGYNSYYVNRYNGRFPYMDMFTKELVPEIDSLYRTKADRSQRAVMGYSMGGYGALILPAMNPDLFGVSVPLSMSFRTDEQYMAEFSDGFDYQWGSIFGGVGTKGSDRLTDYFKQNSPFYFFNGGDHSRFNELRFFIDCGDDEESLSVTNSALHCLMRDNDIPHEYRVSDGAHSWDYWHNSLHEALVFMSTAFQNEDYPVLSADVEVGDAVPENNIRVLETAGMETDPQIMIPPSYDTVVGNYPVIYFINDYDPGKRTNQTAAIFSLFYNAMLSGKMIKALVVEIPRETETLNVYDLQNIVMLVDKGYATRKESRGRMLMGNGKSGDLLTSVVISDTSSFSSCVMFNVSIDTSVAVSGGSIFYYLDGCDMGESYKAYHNLFLRLRDSGNEFEYRIRQGDDSYQSFLAGLSESFPVLKRKLKI